jgi:hypothetical protein
MLTAILTKSNDFSEVVIETSRVEASSNHGQIYIRGQQYIMKDSGSEADPDNYILDAKILNSRGVLVQRYA